MASESGGRPEIREREKEREREVLVVLYFHPVYFLLVEILKGTIELLSKHVYGPRRLWILDFTK